MSHPGDRIIIGNSRPHFPFGLQLSGRWKGIDLSIFLQGIGKRDWYPAPSNIYFWGIYAQPWTNVLKANLDHWTPQNRHAYFPRVKAYIAEQAQELGLPQTRYLQNAAYLRIKNVTIGYTFPQSITSGLNIDQLRIYLSAEDIFTYDNLKVNLDPEGLSGDIYPFQKTYSIGINVEF